MNAEMTLAVDRLTQVSYDMIEPRLIEDGHPSHAMRLHYNEMPFDLPYPIKQAIVAKLAALPWNQYPDIHNVALRALLAERAGVASQHVLVGNGSSALIQQIFRCFSSFLSLAVLERPTFTFYHQVCQNERLPYLEWNLLPNGFHDLTTFPQLREPALIALTSPNNPLGITLPLDKLQTLLEQYPQCIFIVDEAYGEFETASAVELTQRYTNLLVLKTLSKGYGLASIRFGYVVGSLPLMQLLSKSTIPFGVNSFTELIVREVLTNPAVAQTVRVHRERVKQLRDFVYYLLSELADEHSFSLQPSAANFLLLRFEDLALFERVKDALQTRNILVNYPLPHCLRFTIGKEEEMSQLVRVIKAAVQYDRAA